MAAKSQGRTAINCPEINRLASLLLCSGHKSTIAPQSLEHDCAISPIAISRAKITAAAVVRRLPSANFMSIAPLFPVGSRLKGLGRVPRWVRIRNPSCFISCSRPLAARKALARAPGRSDCGLAAREARVRRAGALVGQALVGSRAISFRGGGRGGGGDAAGKVVDVRSDPRDDTLVVPFQLREAALGDYFSSQFMHERCQMVGAAQPHTRLNPSWVVWSAWRSNVCAGEGLAAPPAISAAPRIGTN